ncbi:MAG: RNA polymerase sigma factor, partial [Planctomycetaceae bacterium]|nr:RNA polymerase sigma factor [Planctomycetaceae bacterium]
PIQPRFPRGVCAVWKRSSDRDTVSRPGFIPVVFSPLHYRHKERPSGEQRSGSATSHPCNSNTPGHVVNWHEIESRFRQDVWAAVYRVLGNEQDALDCMQEVLLEAFQKSQHEQIRNWSAYLRWLATRRAIDQIRTRRNAATASLAEVHEQLTTESKDQLQLLESAEIVRSELTHLPHNQATSFWLFSVEGLTYQEIAELTGQSTNAVGLTIQRARRTLQAKLTGRLQQVHDNKHHP